MIRIHPISAWASHNPDGRARENAGHQRPKIAHKRISSAHVEATLRSISTLSTDSFLLIEDLIIDGDIRADYLSTKTPIFIRSCIFEGDIELRQSSLSSFQIIGCQLNNLDFEGTEITRSLDIRKCRLKGTLCLSNATIHGMTNLNGTEFHTKTGNCIILHNAALLKGLYGRGLHTQGTFTAAGAHIGGGLDLSHSTFKAPNSVAIDMDHARVVGPAFMKRCHTIGEILFINGQIEGQFNLNETTISNPDGDCFTFDQSVNEGGIFGLSLRAMGAIHILGSHINGQLAFRGSEIKSQSKYSLSLDQTKVTNGAFIDYSTYYGNISLNGFICDGQLSLKESVITPAQHEKIAISLNDGIVGGGFYLNNSEVFGSISILRSTIRGDLHLSGLTVANTVNTGINLQGSTISTLHLESLGKCVGEIDLSMTHIGTLATPDHTMSPIELPRLTNAAGWQIDKVAGSLLTDAKIAISWLKTASLYSSDSWEEIARLYARSGLPNNSRKVRFRSDLYSTITSKQGDGIPFSRILYGATVGFGHYPFISLAWFTLLFILTYTAIIINISSIQWNCGDFTPFPNLVHNTETHILTLPSIPSSTDHFCTSTEKAALLISLDSISPVGINSPIKFTTNSPNTIIILFFSKVSSWVLSAFFLGGISGLLRKR